MKQLRIVIAGTFIALLGYTQCSGGIFALPRALAASLGQEQAEQTSVLMSVENNSCLVTEQHIENDEHVKGDHQGCDGSTACLSTAQQQQIRSLSNAQTFDTTVVAYLQPESITNNPDTSFLLARAGPLFEESLLHARSVVKRE